MLQTVTLFPAILAALIVGTDRRIVRALRDKQALSTDSAIALSPRRGIWKWRMRRLMGRGAVVLVPPDRVYLDETGWLSYQRSRRRRVLIVIAILLPLIVLTWINGRPR
jgi:hypothetical protein